MNDSWGYDDSANANQDNSNELNGPKALRDAYDAMKAQNKELQDGLAAIQKDLREQKLSSVFESLGVPGAAALYQGEPDPEKARAWVTTMQSTFGNGNVQGVTPPVAETPPAVQPGEQQQQFERMTEAGQSGVPMGSVEAAAAAVGNATNLNDLIASFQSMSKNGV